MKLYYKTGYNNIVWEEYRFKPAMPYSKHLMEKLNTEEFKFLGWDSSVEDIVVYPGFGWDGNSGPTIEDKTNTRGSLHHDIYYKLIRHGLLPKSYRGTADREHVSICKVDGMPFWRRWYYFNGMRGFAGFAIKEKNIKKVRECGK